MNIYRISFDRKDGPSAELARVLKNRIEARWDTNVVFGEPADLSLAYTGGFRFGEIRKENGKWSRLFPISHAELRQPALLGERMAGYIRRFDGLLQQYFSALPNRRAAVSLVTDAFVSELQ